MDDSIYPNSSEFRFGVKTPDERKDLQAEYDATLEQVPLLKAELDRLTARVKATDSVVEARNIAETHGISLENALIVLSVLHPLLSVEKQIIEEKVKALAKRKR